LVREKHWSDFKTKNFSFGLAAKIISIYIKTVEVLPTKGLSILSQVAYPPIDSILLKNLNTRHKIKSKTNWSTFKWSDYVQVIEFLQIHYPKVPGWKIEVEWKVSDDEVEDLSLISGNPISST